MFGFKELKKEDTSAITRAPINTNNTQTIRTSCGGCNVCYEMTKIHQTNKNANLSGADGESFRQQPCSSNLFQRNVGNSYLQSVAESQINPTPIININTAHSLQRKCECNDSSHSEEDELGQLQRKSSDGIIANTPGNSGINIRLGQDEGHPLSFQTREYMEPRFRMDFSNVRLHDNPQANQTASQIQARAFTYGNHIWLNAKESEDNRNLLAHELTHVIQQQKSSSNHSQTLSVSSPTDAAEYEAESVAQAIISGHSLQRPIGTTEPTTIHRVLGIELPSHIRPLDPAELAIVRPIYGNSLLYGQIFISDGVGADRRPFTLYVPPLGTVIQVGPAAYRTPGSDSRLLIHEIAHSWQSQHHASRTQYIINSVASQAAASIVGGNAYCYVPGRFFFQYGAEQIAQQAEDGETAIISHMSSIPAGAIDPTLNLSIPRWETPGATGVHCPP